MKREDIKHIIEAVMFAYGEPISIKELNSIINNEEFHQKKLNICYIL